MAKKAKRRWDSLVKDQTQMQAHCRAYHIAEVRRLLDDDSADPAVTAALIGASSSSTKLAFLLLARLLKADCPLANAEWVDKAILWDNGALQVEFRRGTPTTHVVAVRDALEKEGA